MVGAPVCLGEGVTQSGVEYIVWQRGLRIFHYCHLGSNSQCWSNCQLNYKSNSPKWSPSLKYCVSSRTLAYTILLSHSQWRVVFLCLTMMIYHFNMQNNMLGYLLPACNFFPMTHFEVIFTSLFHKSNYNCTSDFTDISMCTEEILMKYLSFLLYISINRPGTSNCFFFVRYQI